MKINGRNMAEYPLYWVIVAVLTGLVVTGAWR